MIKNWPKICQEIFISRQIIWMHLTKAKLRKKSVVNFIVFYQNFLSLFLVLSNLLLPRYEWANYKKISPWSNTFEKTHFGISCRLIECCWNVGDNNHNWLTLCETFFSKISNYDPNMLSRKNFNLDARLSWAYDGYNRLEKCEIVKCYYSYSYTSASQVEFEACCAH